ncbi:MAG: MFS transporter [Halomonadaceae bacterium]|nr:MFS transporter [Halomonadaceae bacterium]
MIQAHTRDWWRATLALCLGSFIVFINLYAPQPLLPELRNTFGVSTLMASLVMSCPSLALAASLLIYGTLSDALGRGTIMRVSLLLVALCSLAIALVPSFAGLLGLRLLQGLVLAGLPAVAVAWMSDEFEPQAMMLAVGLYISANSLGGIGGRVMGGWAGEVGGWSLSFLVVGTISLVGAAIFWRLLPPARHFTPGRFRLAEALSGIKGHLNTPVLLVACLIGGLNFMVFINQYSYITFRLSAAPFGLGSQWLGMLFLTYLGGTLGSAWSGRLSQRWASPLCMMAGIGIFMLGSLVTLGDGLWVIVVGLTISAFGFFLCHATASGWVGRNAKRARGTATALYLVFYYLGASLGGFYLEPFWQFGGWEGVILAAELVLLITLALSAWLWRRGGRAVTASER